MAGIKIVGVPQSKPIHGLSPNFQDMFMFEDLELIRFWRYLETNVAMATHLRCMGLQFMDVPQHKPVHGFSPKFKGMFPQEDLELVRFSGLSTVVMETHFKDFGSCG